MRIVLASASPRRAALLQQAGVPFEVRPTRVDESARAGESAVAHARRVAAAKAEAARSTEPMAVEEVILAADTEVWRPPDGAPLGKPRDRAHAESVLRMLTEGPPHCVSTAWVLAPHRMAPELHDETTRVWMRPIDTAELADYLDTDEWCDKAGGYGIQGRAGAFVTRIDGSYSNVVGLPLAQVIERLRALQEGTRR